MKWMTSCYWLTDRKCLQYVENDFMIIFNSQIMYGIVLYCWANKKIRTKTHHTFLRTSCPVCILDIGRYISPLRRFAQCPWILASRIFFPILRASLLFTSTGFFPSAAENLAFKVFPLQRKKEQEETFYDFHTTKLDGRTSDHFFLFSVCIQHECYYGANQPFRRSLVFSLELS